MNSGTNGAMFRGEPPLNMAENRNPIDYSSMAKIRFTYFVDVCEVEIHGLPKPKLYLVQISLCGKFGAGGKYLSKKTKGPVAQFHKSPRNCVYTCMFEFDTSRSNFIQVESLFSS